jgi:prepilin-type N-terminal cleavage/methylation domain-containing protein/prepilin-type processing-associated H-X9-DG protein
MITHTLKGSHTIDQPPRRGFTLLELVVVVFLLALLVPVLAMGLTRSNPAGKSLQCLYNTRQLTVGWQMYAYDNHEKFPPVLHGSEAQGGSGDPTWGAGWIAGWFTWDSLSDNTNVTFLINQKYARMAPYLGATTNLFKCPADNYLSPLQQTLGWSQRARSYSASLAIGPGNAQNGPWDPIYQQITKMSGLAFPKPAETFLYLDEHPDSINDPGFFSPNQTSLLDVPSTLHNGAASFSFIDGHAELHRWTGCLTQARARQVQYTYINNALGSAGDPDLHWLSYHTSRAGTNSY